MSAPVTVNGKRVTPAPLIVILAPHTPVPTIPGYVEHSQWHDGTGTITVRYYPDTCPPAWATRTTI